MRATIAWLGAVGAFALLAASAQADPYLPGYQPAPGACGPGCYNGNYGGAVYGPSYWMNLPPMPFNGMLPPMQNVNGNQFGFPTHPYARSPRDFFMLDP